MADTETRRGQTSANPEATIVKAHDDSTALSTEHRRMLEIESGITPDVVEARGYRTVTTKTGLRGLGFSDAQARTPALLIPVFDVWGKLTTYQARPANPRIVKGKALKYETPKGSSMALDVPPMVRQHLANPKLPIWFTEGAKKADSAVSRDLVCVAFLGVWNFRGTNDEGGKAILTAFEAIAFNGRRVYLAFDSDVIEKESVWKALVRFGAVAEQRGADVRVIRMPGGAHGAKTGIDDYFVAGGTVESLVATAQAFKDFATTKPGDSGPYRFEHGGIWYSPDSETDRMLVNFEAEIVAEVRRDDGAETRLHFEIEGRHGNTVRQFTIPAVQFAGLTWTAEHLGASAAISPGYSAKEHTRYAIQILSKPEKRHEYAHTGWATIEGERFYLTASGGIGAAGLRADVTVRLDGALSNYELPEPPTGDTLKDAVRASLAVLDVAPIQVTGPVYAAIWRAPLGEADYSGFVAGQTGEGKSAVTALAAQHYGPRIGAEGKNFAGNFEATANALEAQAFTLKDALFVVDDYNPAAAGSVYERARYEQKAERLFRGAANKAGRGRMRADTSLAAPKYPRGFVLASGEDIPRGHSLRSRLFITELPRGSMSWETLTNCQHDAETGIYAQALAGWVQWLAAHPEKAARLPDLRRKLRGTLAATGTHRRTPSTVADMAASFHIFLDFATETGAIDRTGAETLFERVYVALLRVAREQDEHQIQSEPSLRFRQLLAGAVASGRAHLASSSGGEPDKATAWGWREDKTADGTQRWRPQGSRIGWIEREAAYLEPSASYAAAQRLAQESGDSLGVSETRLWKTLKERGLLLSTEQEARRSLKVRRTFEGRTMHVLHIARDFFEADGSVVFEKADKADIGNEANDNFGFEDGQMSAFVGGMSAECRHENGKATMETPITTRDSGANVGFVGISEQTRDTHEEKTRDSLVSLSLFETKADIMPTLDAQKSTFADSVGGSRHCEACKVPILDDPESDLCSVCRKRGAYRAASKRGAA